MSGGRGGEGKKVNWAVCVACIPAFFAMPGQERCLGMRAAVLRLFAHGNGYGVVNRVAPLFDFVFLGKEGIGYVIITISEIGVGKHRGEHGDSQSEVHCRIVCTIRDRSNSNLAVAGFDAEPKRALGGCMSDASIAMSASQLKVRRIKSVAPRSFS